MEDLSAKLEKLPTEAKDCDLIGKLATDLHERDAGARPKRSGVTQKIRRKRRLSEPFGTWNIGHRMVEDRQWRRNLPCAVLLATLPLSAPVFTQGSYDGVWSVTVVTNAGNCEANTRYPLTVLDGNVIGSPDVSGSVDAAGLVRVFIRGALANGQLTGSAGSGKWNAASVGVACSGRWQASKR